MSTCSFTVNQNNLSGSQLLVTDTGSYSAPIASRILTVFDAFGNQLFQFSMGNNLTQIVTISADAFFQFILSVTDNTGVVPTAEVDYVADGYYTASYLAQYTSTNCSCQLDNSNLDIAELSLNAALRFNLAGNFSAAQSNIVAANFWVNFSPVVQFV